MDVADSDKSLTQPLKRYLHSRLSAMTDDLRRMLESHTYVYNTDRVNALGNWLSNRLRHLGFQRRVYAQDKVGHILGFTNHPNPHHDVLLLCHLDAPHLEEERVPFRQDHGRFFGSGVAESKGGLAVLLSALQALQHTGQLESVRCGVLLTTDENLVKRYSQIYIEAMARQSHYVVGLKYGDPDGGVVISCSGMALYQVDLTGTKDTATAEAPNLLGMFCQKVMDWQNLSTPEDGISVTVAALRGQTHYGQAPDVASTVLVARFPEQHQGTALANAIQQIAEAGIHPPLHIEVRREVYRDPTVTTAAQLQFFQRVQKLSEALAIPVRRVHRSLSTDLCFVPAGIPALDGFGPLGGGARSVGEYICRDSLVDRALLLALVLRDCANRRP